MADKILKYKTGLSPIKMIDNGDGTFSVATTVMNPVEGGSTGVSKVSESIKVPAKFMEPQILNRPGYPMYVDTDGTLYGENSGQLWSTTDDGVTSTVHFLASDLDPTLTRFDAMTITTSGKVILTAKKSNHSGGQIWRADSIGGVFTKVLEVVIGGGFIDAAFRQSNFWHHRAFGKDILLAGTYGQMSIGGAGHAGRLYMSLDEGATWTLVFTTPETETVNNRHVHSTAYDPYYNWIWVTYGDGGNHGISYSPDLGATWIQVSNTLQPTTVIPLEKSVAFGSDDPFHVGIYAWERPETSDTIASIPKDIVQKWHKLHAFGTTMIARKGVVVDSQHAAILFASSTTATGEVIAITGDGGKSWHPAYGAIVRTGDNGFTNAGPDGEFYYNIGAGKIAKFVMPPFYDSSRIV